MPAMGTHFELTGVLNMNTMGKAIAGGLLTCMAAVMAAGPAGADDADAPGAPQEHAWGHGEDGDRHEGAGRDGWHHDGAAGGGWHHRHGGAAAMFHELGLTDAQRASMKSILEAAKPAMQELREKLQGNFRLLRQTSPDDKNYAAVVSRISQENGALTSKLISQRAAIYAKCYAVLAPVQKTHLAELQAKRANWMEEHQEHMKEHMQGHMDGHDPHEGAMGGSAPN